MVLNNLEYDFINESFRIDRVIISIQLKKIVSHNL
jgi:hypothetical protein